MAIHDRLIIYSKEQLEPGSRLLLGSVTAFFIEILLSIKFGFKASFVGLVVPSLSVFFLLVYYRVSDEFKDFETDKKFFPDRPIPSGRLFLTDLKWLLILFASLGLILNLLLPYALKEFMAALIFTYAMGKWFFIEKTISKNRLYAFFTHGPVGYFLYWYQIKYLSAAHGIELSLAEMISLITFIVIPGFTWEVLRKTYLPKDEMPGYQIYSTMLGFRGSLLFGSVWVIITLLNNFFLVSQFPALVPLKFNLLMLNMILLAIILIHAFKPLMPNLKKIAEGYMALHLLLPLAQILRVYYGL